MTLSNCFKVGKAIFVLGSQAHYFSDILAAAEDKEMPKKQKILRIAIDALTIMTQSAAEGAKARGVVPGTKFALDGVAGAADVIQRVVLLSGKQGPISYGDYLDVGADTLIRVSGLVHDAIVFKPEFFGSQKQLIETGAELGNYIGIIGQNLPYTLSCTNHLVYRLRGRPLYAEAPNPKRHAGITLQAEDTETYIHMKRMQTINELEEIPTPFRYDRILKQFRCALSGKLIRHMLVVAGTEEWPLPIWFDSRAILQKIQDGEKPPQWPEDIAFTRENLREFPEKQNLINTRLQVMLNEVHKANFEFGSLETCVDPENQKYLQVVNILKGIGLERMNAMQDDEITDVVRTRVSPNTIANVCVNTVPHKFHATELPKLTKVIHFTPTVTLRNKPPLSEEELFAATRAALVPEDHGQEDRRALVLAQIPFEIRVSTDLQDLAISSEFVRSDYERKTELLNMMKSVLQVEQLSELSNEDLAERIIEKIRERISKKISKKVPVHVLADSLEHQFAGSTAPTPARAIVFASPFIATDRKPSSADSLFAAARFFFGSQREIDKQELKKSFKFVIYVDTNFQNIEIKEFF